MGKRNHDIKDNFSKTYGGTLTGRWSSNRTNIGNLPRSADDDYMLRANLVAAGFCLECGALALGEARESHNQDFISPEPHKEGCLSALAEAANKAEREVAEEARQASELARIAAARAILRSRK